MLIDLPVDQLHAYQGRNPRPADIDAYWDTALSELDHVQQDLEWVPASFKAPGVACFDLYFTGVRGSRIHAKVLKPTHVKSPMPAVLMFHGYSGSCGPWMDKLSYALAGFVVAALDVRGQAGQSMDTSPYQGNTLRGHIIRGLDDPDPQNMFFRHAFLDTAQLARIVMAMDQVDATRVGAMGGSQGGGLTLACAALTPGLNRAAPLYPFLCDYLRVWEMDLAVAAYEEIKLYFRYHDPTHHRREQVFTKLGYIDNQHLAHRIKSNIMMGVGLMDTICPPSSQFAAYNKITAEKQVVFYPDFGHENIPEWHDRTFSYMAEMLH